MAPPVGDMCAWRKNTRFLFVRHIAAQLYKLYLYHSRTDQLVCNMLRGGHPRKDFAYKDRLIIIVNRLMEGLSLLWRKSDVIKYAVCRSAAAP